MDVIGARGNPRAAGYPAGCGEAEALDTGQKRWRDRTAVDRAVMIVRHGARGLGRTQDALRLQGQSGGLWLNHLEQRRATA